MQKAARKQSAWSIASNCKFLEKITAETQSAQRQRQKILNRRLAQINADGDLRELVFCLSGDDDKQKGKRFCPIAVSRLGKILPSALKSSLSAKIGVNLRFIS